MRIQRLQIHNFRCFKQEAIEFQSSFVVITGANGAGKTSLLEALHYACYLRSFRTHIPKDLLQFNTDSFFIKLVLQQEMLNHEITVGFTGKKKILKVNQKPINSYKELIDYYRIVTVTEDDVQLIKDGPDLRRLFLDQAIILYQPDFLTTMQHLKTIVQNRNSLLSSNQYTQDLHAIWTEKLWNTSKIIQEHRQRFLTILQNRVNILMADHINPDWHLKIMYRQKISLLETHEQFMTNATKLFDQELIMKRSLFGAHLDDFSLTFRDKVSRSFSSRGQQKLTLLLLKIAQLQELEAAKGPVVLLLDDFMNDFDRETSKKLVDLLKTLQCQVIITSPQEDSFFHKELGQDTYQQITLSR